jgi:Peptide N-acetyl-beta-D-glucosaminyl asparaginase amidase A
MKLPCRWVQKFQFVALLVASLISTRTILAQSTNRQIGTPFTVTADPLVPRPPERPCVVPLFSNYQFAHYSEDYQSFQFTPPGNCSGPWEKVVLEADFSENAGDQFDRTAIIYLGNLNVYFGTTPEPLSTLTNTWHVERDITDYSAALSTPQQGTMILVNCTSDCPPPYNVLNGVFTVNAQIEFYPAQRGRGHGRHGLGQGGWGDATPDQVLPLVQTNSSGGVSLPATLQPGDQLSTTFNLPTNTVEAYLDVLTENQYLDETWWGCFPNNLSSINEVYGCGNTNFRETEITIDGQPAGISPVSAWVFTGDLPDDWMPIPGAQTLDLVPYRVNLTPFAGLLSNGQPHTISLGVFNDDSYFSVAASLLLFLDPGTTQVTGAVTEDTLANPNPVVTENLHGTATVKGTIAVQSDRSFTITGYVNTSRGKVATSISQKQHFFSTEKIDFDTVNFTVLDQNTSIDTSISSKTTVSSWAGRISTEQLWSFPFTVQFTAPVSSAPFGYTQAFTQKYNNSEQVSFNGFPLYFSSLTNAVNATDVSPTSSSQDYTLFDSDGAFYDCNIGSNNAVLTSVGRGCGQGEK